MFGKNRCDDSFLSLGSSKCKQHWISFRLIVLTPFPLLNSLAEIMARSQNSRQLVMIYLAIVPRCWDQRRWSLPFIFSIYLFSLLIGFYSEFMMRSFKAALITSTNKWRFALMQLFLAKWDDGMGVRLAFQSRRLIETRLIDALSHWRWIYFGGMRVFFINATCAKAWKGA